jgi:hypothetical protein
VQARPPVSIKTLRLDEIAVAAAGGQRFRDAAATDDDLASIRDDPRFPR